MKKVALHNLGCKVNAYETEAMQQQLEENGYEIVSFSDRADIYIINTCTVTNIADRKSRQMLHRSKKNNPDAIVIAVGCYVQAAAKELEKDEAIDIVIGNNKKKDLITILENYIIKKETGNTIIDMDKLCEYESLHLSNTSDRTRAYIKIQDGCNQFCTYCIIPFTRGRVRSRSVEDILKEVNILAKRGYKEIVLTGIHLSSYGVDFSDEQINLLYIIKELHKVTGIERIRTGSLEPLIVTEEFVRELSTLKKVCPHFHLSLQSGCDETLKRMNRRYNTDQYNKICSIIRKYYDRPAITTDVIVGFPGETEEEFETTVDFLQKIGFAEMHIFKYSKRKDTKASVMINQVDDKLKTIRSTILLEYNKKMSKKFRESFIGKKVKVLIEEDITIKDKKYQVGYTKEYVKTAVISDLHEGSSSPRTSSNKSFELEKLAERVSCGIDYKNQIIDVSIIQILNNEILLAEL